MSARRLVAIAAGAGLAHDEIAMGLGIERAELVRKYAVELSNGAYRVRLEVLAAMHRSALAGSVAAMRAFLRAAPRVSPPPMRRLGKKEIAQADSKVSQIGTAWESLLHGPTTRQ